MSDEKPAETRRKKKRKGALLQRVEYAIYRFVAARARHANEDSLIRWGARLGSLARMVLRKRTRLALRNLRASFPDKSDAELDRIMRACWHHFGRELLLYLKAQTLTFDEIVERCALVNRELLDEAFARGKGVVLISAHWGGWEIGGLALMAAVRNVRMVARPLDNEFLEADLQKLRASTGAEVVDRRKAARVLLRALSDGAMIVLLPDQAVIPREGELVPFLGRPAWTTTAPAKMAIRAGSTIVFAFCIPDGPRHRLEFVEPIRVDELSDAKRDPVVLTTKINDVISRRISAMPELWLWMHDRWKGTPESEEVDG